GAQAVADLALVLIDLGGIEVAIAEPQRLLDQPRATAAAQLPGAEPDRGDFGAVGFDKKHGRVLARTSLHYVAKKFEWLDRGGFHSQSGEHRLGRMGDHGKQRTRRAARGALALLPVADGFDGHAELCGKFSLRELGSAAKVAHF